MRYIRIKAVFAASGWRCALAACGDAGDDDDEHVDVKARGERRRRVRRRHPDEGARRATARSSSA